MKVDTQKDGRDKNGNTAHRMEIILDIAVTHPYETDIWVGIWPPTLRKRLKTNSKTAVTIPKSIYTHLENPVKKATSEK